MDDGGDGPAGRPSPPARRMAGRRPRTRTAVSPDAEAPATSTIPGFALRGLAMLGRLTSGAAWPRRRFSCRPDRNTKGDSPIFVERKLGQSPSYCLPSLPPPSSSRCWPGRSLVETAGGGNVFARASHDRRQMVLDVSGRCAAATAATPKRPQRAEQPLSNLPGRAVRGNGGPRRPGAADDPSRWSGPAAVTTAVSRNWPPSSRSGTEPTAAAVGLFTVLGAVDEGAREGSGQIPRRRC